MRVIESPREGMQGFPRIIPARDKVRYINALLRVGFDTVETGSLVSSRLIPQMADSLEVLKQLDLSGTRSNRMFLVVNRKGAEKVSEMDEITHLSYPFAFSPTFLKLNVNASVQESYETAAAVTELCEKRGKKAVVYISMAFGNPYGDPWDQEMLLHWTGRLHQAGAATIMLSNVSVEIGEKMIAEIYNALIPMFPDIEFGLHLHTAGEGWYEKVNAAFLAGCRRFDSVTGGLGGCPMAGGELLGNLGTDHLLSFAAGRHMPVGIDPLAWEEAKKIGEEIFMNIEY